MAPLDVDLLNYALDCDRNFSGTAPKNLVITCLDQLNGQIEGSVAGKMMTFAKPENLLRQLNVKPGNLLLSYSDRAEGMVKL